jgi:hypothetical protein
VGLERISKQIKNDANQIMPMKSDVKCDNIIKDNLTDLTSINSSNLILIKEKITPIETYKIVTILKIMSLVL